MQQKQGFIKVGNQQIIKRIKRTQTVCTDLMIVTNTPEEYLNLGILTVVDIIPQGPLSGVHAGLVNSKTITICGSLRHALYQSAPG